MKIPMKKFLPVFFLFLLVCCTAPIEEVSTGVVQVDISNTISQTDMVDIVIVMDNTYYMDYWWFQEDIAYGLYELFRGFEEENLLPDIHLGVISTDLGVGEKTVPGCEDIGGDQGRFLSRSNNQHGYIVDVKPVACNIQEVVGDSGICEYHDCTAYNCTQLAFLNNDIEEVAGLALYEDVNGFPRCRNYEENSLSDTIWSMVSLGVHGCAFQQPLEALKLNMEHAKVDENGFYRSGALFAFNIITMEDDCSAKDERLFTIEGDYLSEFGYLHSFRCTEFGIVCNEPWVRDPAIEKSAYTNCRPRTADDPLNMLHGLDGYRDYFLSQHQAERMAGFSIAGITDGTMLVHMYDDRPHVQSSCREPWYDPAFRIDSFLKSIESEPESGIYLACSNNQIASTETFGQKILRKMEGSCLPFPLAYCEDPKEYLGINEKPVDGEQVCQPKCTLSFYNKDEMIVIPQCPPDYRNGKPDKIDSNLPVEMCWWIISDEKCGSPDYPLPSNGARIIVSQKTRRKLPDISGICDLMLPPTE
jgi:hypothetical protein